MANGPKELRAQRVSECWSLQLLTSSLLESLVQNEPETPGHHKVAAAQSFLLLFLFCTSAVSKNI